MLKHTLIIASTIAPTALFAGYWGDLITSEGGVWDDDLCAIHLIHMSGGRFLVWGYGTNSPNETKTWVWNSFTNSLSVDPYTLEGANIFCCGVSQLADGRPIIAGGVVNEASGIKATYIFNPSSNKWSEGNDLNEARWYPTLAMRSDGVMSAISGWIEPPSGPNEPPVPAEWALSVELFNAGAQTWSNFTPSFDGSVGGTFTPHFYPFMIPYHDPGESSVPKLFFAGRATASDYGSTSLRGSLNTYSLSFTSGSAAVWKPLGGNSSIQGSGAVIMINSTDATPIDRGIVYKFGGEQGGSPVASGRMINLNDGGLAAWVATEPMNVARAECNIVALPDGRIAAVGGANAAGPHNLYSAAIYTLEIYDPAADDWTEISPSMDATRMYHSIAALTPNATIFTAGGEYILILGGTPIREANAQEYFPSYFEDQGARRPVFIDTPQNAYWDTTITVRVSGSVDYFSLVKLSSTTHANDTTQRFIKVTPAQASSGQYHYLKMPKNGGIAPPGDYMLFAVYGGLPSVARYVRIGESPE